MASKAIPKARGVYLQAFVEPLRNIGAPVETWLEDACLPIDLDAPSGVYVNANLALRFIARAARAESIEDFGWLAARDLRPSAFKASYVRRANAAPNLLNRVRAFIAEMSAESPVRGSIARLGERTRIVYTLDGVDGRLETQASEWMQVMALVQIMRSGAGRFWVPNEIAFTSRFAPCEEARAAMDGPRLRFGRPETAIIVPTALLAEPVREPLASVGAPAGPEPDVSSVFGADLVMLMEPYLAEGMEIGLAAEIAQMSVRTLQRRLRADGMSYSELVDAARFRAAGRLLKSDDARIIDVSLAVGYDDPSHFARAFKRIGGMSPRDFRRVSLQAGVT